MDASLRLRCLIKLKAHDLSVVLCLYESVRILNRDSLGILLSPSKAKQLVVAIF